MKATTFSAIWQKRPKDKCAACLHDSAPLMHLHWRCLKIWPAAELLFPIGLHPRTQRTIQHWHTPISPKMPGASGMKGWPTGLKARLKSAWVTVEPKPLNTHHKGTFCFKFLDRSLGLFKAPQLTRWASATALFSQPETILQMGQGVAPLQLAPLKSCFALH